MGILTPDETLLGLLAAQKQHGYQLLDCFRDPAHLGRVWNLSTSQLYAVLKRLAAQGLIQGQEVELPNVPPRTVYTLTEAGQKCLQAWLDEKEPSASIHRVRVEFLSRLYIARLLNRPTTTIVRQQKIACRQKREELMGKRGQAAPGMDYLTLEFVIGQLDAVLQWIDRCEIVPADEGELE